MPSSIRCCAFLLSLLASPGFAQADGAMAQPNPPRTLTPERRTPPDFRVRAGRWLDWRPVGDGLVAAMSVGDGMQLGVGRFSVSELDPPRTHMEAQPRSADARRRQTSIAAVRFNFSF
jgi:hypothetical protein